MESRKFGVAAAVGGLVVAIVLFIVLSGRDSEDNGTTTATSTSAQTSQTTTRESKAGGQGGASKKSSGGGSSGGADEAVITIKDGAAVGGVQNLTFNKGDEIRFEVDSDAAHEIHFHGYDVIGDVPKNGSIKFDVPADADGVYEVEIEDTATQIAQITVNP